MGIERIGIPAQRAIDLRQPGVGSRCAGVDGDRVLVGCLGLLHTPRGQQHIPRAPVGLDGVRVEGQRQPVMGERLFVLAFALAEAAHAQVGGRVSLLYLEQPFVRGAAGGIIAKLPLRFAQTAQRWDVVGRSGERPGEGVQRLRVPTLLQVDLAQPCQRPTVMFVALAGAVVGGNRLFEPSFGAVEVAQPAIDRRCFWLQGQRGFVGGVGLFKVARLPVEGAQPQVGRQLFLVQLQRLLEGGDALFGLSGFGVGDTQQIPGLFAFREPGSHLFQ